MSLHIYTGNRMEVLARVLAGLLRTPLSHPFAPEIIVTQSVGMQRWLSMELARHLGVWANCRYLFPNAFVERLFNATLPDLPDSRRFSSEALAWRIFGLLPSLAGDRRFSPVNRYLADDPDDPLPTVCAQHEP